MDEKEYRKQVEKVYRKLEDAFDTVDPDLVELENSQGALTLLFADKTKCILSTQPAVRQLWVALASKGVALHFNYDPQKDSWFDDKGKNVELFAFVKQAVKDSAGVQLQIK